MDIKELVSERLAILATPPAPKPKPRFLLMAVESRDWVAVYFENIAPHIHPTHFPFNILYRKYSRRHTALNAESVKFILENAGHFVTIV